MSFYAQSLVTKITQHTSQGKQFRASASQTYLLGVSLGNVEDVGNSDTHAETFQVMKIHDIGLVGLKPCAKLSQCS